MCEEVLFQIPREGVEPTTYALGEHRSILLSYRGLCWEIIAFPLLPDKDSPNLLTL